MNLGKRIAIIGNGGGGKSTLARKLGAMLELPVIHVDSIQFLNGWQRRPAEDCDRMLNQAAKADSWIIDGFGSDDVIARRITLADTAVFVDFSIWRHYWWAIKRQLASRKGQRRELPDNCPEFSVAYTWKLVTVMWLVHREYTPWFRTLLSVKHESGNVVVFKNPQQMARFVSHLERQSAQA